MQVQYSYNSSTNGCILLTLVLTLSITGERNSTNFGSHNNRTHDFRASRCTWLPSRPLERRACTLINTHAHAYTNTHTCIDWLLEGKGIVLTTPLLQYVTRLDGSGETVGFAWGGWKESRPRCSLFVGFPSLFAVPSGERLALPMCRRGKACTRFSGCLSPYFLREERCS